MNRPFRATLKTCTVPGCQGTLFAKDYCNAHYIRSRKGRDMSVPVRHREAGRTCSVPGCDRKHEGKGLCGRHYRQQVRKEFWEIVVEAKGGACQRCGVSYPHVVYDLHHRDPSQKEFSPSNAIFKRSFESLLAEAEKCDLLCANCHRLEHYG